MATPVQVPFPFAADYERSSGGSVIEPVRVETLTIVRPQPVQRTLPFPELAGESYQAQAA